MKRIAMILMFIVVMTILAGCATVDCGTVVDKSYTPARMVYSPIIMGGRNFKIIPRWHTKPALWRILVTDSENSEWWTVTEDIYNNTNIGDIVDKKEWQ